MSQRITLLKEDDIDICIHNKPADMLEKITQKIVNQVKCICNSYEIARKKRQSSNSVHKFDDNKFPISESCREMTKDSVRSNFKAKLCEDMAIVEQHSLLLTTR